MKKIVLFVVISASVFVLSIYGLIYKRADSEMEYSFKSSNDLNLLADTSKLINLDSHSGEESALIQGQLLTLFGEPVYTTPDIENAYSYIIIMENDVGEQFVFNVYLGPSGVAIGGDGSMEGILDAAYELRDYIKRAIPSDFEYEGYYLDGPTKVSQKVVNGKPYFSETEIDMTEYEKAYRLCYPNMLVD